MTPNLAQELDAMSAWRRKLQRQVHALTGLLAEHDLIDANGQAAAEGLGRKLAADQLVLACVAEVSRGKSELLNAIFFADSGRRMLPASPGRTTMCPVELHYYEAQPAELALLPIDTRLEGQSLAELRRQPQAWQRLGLDPKQPEGVAQALKLVTQTRKVSTSMAAALGFWNDSRPQDNPPRLPDGSVEIPAWRHALINYPHPLLQRGLVVVDTPGLNAVGAEPELTLGLLPSAHAIVFILAADTGVSRSDLDIWTTHLDGDALERFVVLNKTDILADPLSTADAVSAQVERQCAQIAQTLQMPRQRVYPLSARDALAARIAGDGAALARSGLPALECALAAELLPRQRELLTRATGAVLEMLRATAARRMTQRRRQIAEQLLELRALRGKSSGKVQALLHRLEAEMGDFDRCSARLTALRAVHLRQQQQLLTQLSSDGLREQVGQMRAAIGSAPLKLGAGRAFRELFERLRQTLAAARVQLEEIQQMLGASYQQLNAEFGFAFTLAGAPSLARFGEELELIERAYARHLGPTQVWRLAGGGFLEQFQRMLLSKLRVVFESAAGEVELWCKSAAAQVEVQVRERRRGFAHRHAALKRVQLAAGELEERIAEVEKQDKRLDALQWRLDAMAAQVAEHAAAAEALPRAADNEPAALLSGAR